MSYSVSNVLAEAGIDGILRWLPFEIEEQDLRNRLKNKMIRPTTIPQTIEDLLIEHAVAREALRLAFEQHGAFATELKGVAQERTIADVFDQSASGKSLIRLMDLDHIIGSGGILAHAPRRAQAMAIMLDAYQPQGVTALAVDSVFMMPHLGVLAGVHEKAALDVFYNDCLVKLGTCVAPVGLALEGEPCLGYEIKTERGTESGTLVFGDVLLIPCEGKAAAVLKPAKNFDVGAGAGKTVVCEVAGGTVGLVLDGRGRPLNLPSEHALRRRALNKWHKALALYPEHD
jgi:hypothetical protein